MKSRASKFTLSVIITAIIVGGVYYWQNSKQSLGTYSSGKYSFQYSENYSLVDDSTKILTVEEQNGNGKLEIFQMKDFGDRPWGFEGTETQEEVDLYAPKEQLTIGTEDKEYNVWLYYSEKDGTTKKELKAIFDSIIIK